MRVWMFLQPVCKLSLRITRVSWNSHRAGWDGHGVRGGQGWPQGSRRSNARQGPNQIGNSGNEPNECQEGQSLRRLPQYEGRYRSSDNPEDTDYGVTNENNRNA